MMRSRRRRPQPPTSGPRMSGVQNMEGLASAVKHVLVYHLLFSLHSIKNVTTMRLHCTHLWFFDIYLCCCFRCTCMAGPLCTDSAPCQLGSRSVGLLFLSFDRTNTWREWDWKTSIISQWQQSCETKLTSDKSCYFAESQFSTSVESCTAVDAAVNSFFEWLQCEDILIDLCFSEGGRRRLCICFFYASTAEWCNEFHARVVQHSKPNDHRTSLRRTTLDIDALPLLYDDVLDSSWSYLWKI